MHAIKGCDSDECGPESVPPPTHSELRLHNNALKELPSGVFNKLIALRVLYLVYDDI
jgi:hypothetical protein